MTDKTNTMRMLEARNVPYTAHYFSSDIHSAEEVAEAVGLPAQEVFKTLVAIPPKGHPLLAIVPGDRELDLKKLARAAKQKKVRMASHRQAESLTGLQVGGISALALLHKTFRVFLDASAERFERILVSAGQRGINLQLPVVDLVEVVDARIADIAR